MTRPLRLLDLFCGEGGAGAGYARAGFAEVVGIDTDPSRLRHYPFECHQADAIEYLLEHGHEFDAVHASPPCTGYTRGTAGVPDRVSRYERLIPATREALRIVGRPYVIENVEDAAPELLAPLTLCGSEFGLRTIDRDGTPLALRRHRLFESSVHLMGAGGCLGHGPRQRAKIAGAYGGARRTKEGARERGGGYVPPTPLLRELLGTPWMTERGCQLSIPPAYTAFLGEQLLATLAVPA